VRYLLDTHTLLWFLADDKRLSDSARELIESQSNDIFISIASLWEIAIKVNIHPIAIGQGYSSPFT
jgi:PIN domain nuclease of toxin-antitoxin system